MDVTNHVYPTRSRIEELLADDSSDSVVMLNLLKFRERASYADGRASDLSGRAAYNLYGSAMTKIVEKHGGRVVFAGVHRLAGLEGQLLLRVAQRDVNVG
jgi:hypothetical protein